MASTASPEDSAGTDGVSLEIMKRQDMLKSMGHQVAISSAYGWSDFPVSALEFDANDVTRIMKGLFGRTISESADESLLESVFEASTSSLKQELYSVLNHYQPDVVFVHNMFCLPIHPAATVALARLLEETEIPCVAIHHDILSEGAYKFIPTCKFAQSLLEFYFPPLLSNIMHWTINSRNQTLLRKKGVEANVIHDTIDFGRRLKPEEYMRIREALRTRYGISIGDIVLLVAARIVPNKQLELAGHITAEMDSLRYELFGTRLYNGEVYGERNKIVLVLAGRPERAFQEYRRRINNLFDNIGINWVYVGDAVRSIRSEAQGLYALYPDIYSVADLVLYPTAWEGFGNQLIEAFAAYVPCIIFEYPVYKEDIGPKNFKVISLGDRILEQLDSNGLVQIPQKVLTNSVRQAIHLLSDPLEYRSVTLHNAELGKRYFSFSMLREHLVRSLHWASSLQSPK